VCGSSGTVHVNIILIKDRILVFPLFIEKLNKKQKKHQPVFLININLVFALQNGVCSGCILKTTYKDWGF
jgi:hypothetical protein